MERFPIDDERLRHFPDTVNAARQENSIFDEATNLADLEAQDLGEFGNGQPVKFGRCAHGSSLPWRHAGGANRHGRPIVSNR